MPRNAASGGGKKPPKPPLPTVFQPPTQQTGLGNQFPSPPASSGGTGSTGHSPSPGTGTVRNTTTSTGTPPGGWKSGTKTGKWANGAQGQWQSAPPPGPWESGAKTGKWQNGATGKWADSGGPAPSPTRGGGGTRNTGVIQGDPNIVGSDNHISNHDGSTTYIAGGTGGGTGSGISAAFGRAAQKVGDTQDLAGKSVDEAVQGAKTRNKRRKTSL